MLLAACVQMRAVDDVAANLAALERLVGQAVALGAGFVATPENTTFLGPPSKKVAIAESIDGPTHQVLARIAAAHGVWLSVGSVAESNVDDPSRCFNTSLLFDPAGKLRAFYRKIHLFDIDLPDGTRFRESAHISAGRCLAVAGTPFGRVGLSICYDLRFPELYGRLVDEGADILLVPSAFTVTTGRAHWHALLRARAIETQCYVLAAAQSGEHGNGRVSYGHSVIYDPWGELSAELPEGEGVIVAPIDLRRVAEVRRSMPVVQHKRLFSVE